MYRKGTHRKPGRIARAAGKVARILRRHSVIYPVGAMAALVIIAATAGSVPAGAATMGQRAAGTPGQRAAYRATCAAHDRWYWHSETGYRLQPARLAAMTDAARAARPYLRHDVRHLVRQAKRMDGALSPSYVRHTLRRIARADRVVWRDCRQDP